MNWFDILITVLVIASFVKGYISGLAMQIAYLAGLILGAVFAGKISELIAPRLIALIGGSPHIIAPISYIIAFALILTALIYGGRLLTSFIKAIHLTIPNRIAGAFFGSIKWLILVSILFNLIIQIDQHKILIKEEVREQAYTYPLVLSTAQLVVPYLRFDYYTLSTP